MGLTLYKYFTIIFCTKYRKKNQRKLMGILSRKTLKNMIKKVGGEIILLIVRVF